MSESDFTELQALCGSFGFARKGKSFFRVWGDGVLQIIKYGRERAFQADLICVGLFSMYGPLPSKMFTAPGSIAKYSVMNCYGQNALPPFFAPPVQTQMDMLRDRVMPWLNSIDTQKELLDAMTKLDRRWNDSAKIGPYLACGQQNHAKKVIKEIIGPSAFAQIRNAPKREETVDELLARVDREPTPYCGMIEIIDRGEDAVCAYLQANYAKNAEHAKFCMSEQNAG